MSVLPVIRSTIDCSASSEENKQPELLVHIFSNGGSAMLYYLYEAYAVTSPSQGTSDSTLPHVTVFDSVPGGFSYWGLVGAVLHTIPNKLWARLVATPLVHSLGLCLWVRYRVLRVAEETRVWGAHITTEAKPVRRPVRTPTARRTKWSTGATWKRTPARQRRRASSWCDAKSFPTARMWHMPGPTRRDIGSSSAIRGKGDEAMATEPGQGSDPQR